MQFNDLSPGGVFWDFPESLDNLKATFNVTVKTTITSGIRNDQFHVFASGRKEARHIAIGRVKAMMRGSTNFCKFEVTDIYPI